MASWIGEMTLKEFLDAEGVRHKWEGSSYYSYCNTVPIARGFIHHCERHGVAGEEFEPNRWTEILDKWYDQEGVGEQFALNYALGKLPPEHEL